MMRGRGVLMPVGRNPNSRFAESEVLDPAYVERMVGIRFMRGIRIVNDNICIEVNKLLTVVL